MIRGKLAQGLPCRDGQVTHPGSRPSHRTHARSKKEHHDESESIKGEERTQWLPRREGRAAHPRKPAFAPHLEKATTMSPKGPFEKKGPLKGRAL